MELKDFISQSIKDIIDGVIGARKYAAEKGALVNVYEKDSIRKINFDIAVTTSQTKAVEAAVEGKGNIMKILVAGLDLKGSFEKVNSNISRINFTIPVILSGKHKIKKSE